MKKCVIITTINPPTETIRQHMNNNNYDVIIVGDKKHQIVILKKTVYT